MKTTSINYKKPRQRIRALLSAVLAALLLTVFSGSITAKAEGDAQYNANSFAKLTQEKITYKVEITSESQASGWNSASLQLGYRGDEGKTDRQNWDIKDDISNGKTITKEFSLPMDDVPSVLKLYLDFGGGFTVRSHSGSIKFYADGEEVMNEPYSARSYPFNSSDETLLFQIDGIAPTIVELPGGSTEVYSSVKKAWTKAMETNGATVRLWENSYVRGTLEVKNNITLDLNGFLFANTEVGSLFKVKNGGSLSIVDSDPNRDTGETFYVTTGMTSENDTENRSFKLKGGGIYHGGSEGNGGVINVEKGGALNVTGCTFTDCHSSEGSGGAIYCEGSMSLKGTKFIFCTATEGNGGAIALNDEPEEISLDSLTFDRCAAENGGAISTSYGGEAADMTNCTFNNCYAEENGGGVYCASTVSLTAGKLTFNKCAAENGGGIYNGSSSPVTLADSAFVSCFADYGGGLSYGYGGIMKLENTEFNLCSAEKNGGAIHLLSVYNIYSGKANVWVDITISNCNIHHCSAKGSGGGLYAFDDGKPMSETVKTKLNQSVVSDNTAKTGGGVYVESHYVYLVNSSITNNKAQSKYGGGVYVDSMYDIEVADEIVIRGNTADGKENNLCLQNGTFSSAKLYSGGLYDGSYIGISSTSSGSSTVAKNVSQFQMSKFMKADDNAYGLSMTNTKEVETKLYASMISRNASFAIIIGGAAVIICSFAVLYVRKLRRRGKIIDADNE